MITVSTSGERLTFVEEAFDSDMLGGPVRRLTVPSGVELAREELRKALEQAGREHVRLLICRVESESVPEEALTSAGFQRVEELVVYERPLEEPLPLAPSLVRAARGSDRSPCMALARIAFTFDRYHADPLVSDEIAARVKEAWVANSFGGRADRILVAEMDSTIKGFITCLFDPGRKRASIDLIATAPTARGRGLGQALVASALRSYLGVAQTMRVGTQSNNDASRSLYEKNGFQLIQRWATFHAHPSGSIS